MCNKNNDKAYFFLFYIFQISPPRRQNLISIQHYVFESDIPKVCYKGDNPIRLPAIHNYKNTNPLVSI